MKRIIFISYLIVALAVTNSYAGIHLGLASAIKGKVQELKDKQPAAAAESTAPNNAPVIASLTADSASIPTGAAATITCSASDLDNDPLTYTWSAASGTITGSGSQVSWTAPAISGSYTIYCTVSDGKSGTIRQSMNMTVSVSSVSYSQMDMSIARDASGNMVIVWIDSRNGAIDVYGAKYNTSGTKIWGDKKLNQSVLLDGVWDQYPKVKCDINNNIYISYAASTGNLRLEKFDTDGTFLWDSQADSATYSAEWCLHDLAVDSSSNIYIIYQRYGPQGAGSYMSKFDTSGTKLWGDKYSGVGNDPCIAINGGYIYVASGDGTIALIDTSGNQLMSVDIGFAVNTRIAVDSVGNVCAAYNADFTVHYEKYNSTGTRISGPALVSVAGEMYLQKELPAISIDSSDNKYIVFRDRYDTGSGYDIRLMGVKLSATDTNSWTQGGIQLCQSDFLEQNQADIETDGSGGLFAIWMDNRMSSTNNIYANKILSAGTRAWTNDLALY
jgi:hypothetical protein